MARKHNNGGRTMRRDNVKIRNDFATLDSSRHHIGDKVQNNTYYQNVPEDRLRSSKRAQDRLEEYVSRGAAHDSAERGADAPRCFPETREAVQGEMMSFVDPGGEERVFWLSGPAGAGKTAIMGSVCDNFQALGWLAGSFYFSTSANKVDRCSSRYLIPTLAYHFFQLDIPGLPTAILASIDANPSVFDKRLDQQVEILLLQPLRKVCETEDRSNWPKVVVVDGVDECAEDHGRKHVTDDDKRRSREDNQRELLSALIQASNDPVFPFRILVASRPEHVIERYFASLPKGAIKKTFLDNSYSPRADIELFTRAMLHKIGLDHGLGGDWFSCVGQSLGIYDVPKHVAHESSGQFVYAATVVRFVQGTLDTPLKQLQQVLNWRSFNMSNPFAALDGLYNGIVRISPDPPQAVLWIQTMQRYSSRQLPPWYGHAFLQSSPAQMARLFAPLSSLVRFIDAGGHPDFYIYHKSLTDFLDNPARSGDLHIQDNIGKRFLCHRNYEILKDRGPQVPILPPGSTDAFLAQFCQRFSISFPISMEYHYEPEDVTWWLANVPSDDLAAALPYAYHKAHQDCRWYDCRPTCKVWRKGIMLYATASGWRVPTMLEGLRDRVKPFPYYCHESDGSEISIQGRLHPPNGPDTAHAQATI